MTQHDWEDESIERALFAARARVDEEAPPPVSAVFEAIEAPAPPRVLRRAAIATIAAAACVAGIFAAASALTPERERIVSDRGDAEAPAQQESERLYTSVTGASTCEMDRTIAVEPDRGLCTAEAVCSIAGP